MRHSVAPFCLAVYWIDTFGGGCCSFLFRVSIMRSEVSNESAACRRDAQSWSVMPDWNMRQASAGTALPATRCQCSRSPQRMAQ